MSNLSRIPSELLTQAVDHLEFLEKNPLYKINMNKWHVSNPNQPCQVCLAGAWLAGETDISPKETVCPNTLVKEDYRLYEAMRALDEFRSGYIHDGLAELDLYGHKHLIHHYVEIIEYKYDPALFKKQMRDMAANFKAAGI